MISTQILIVGAGPSGLTCSMLLNTMNISNILIERKTEISNHPRAIGFTCRTIEIFRSLGITEKEIQSAPEDFRLIRKRVESLAGKHYEESHWTDGPNKGKGAPTTIPPGQEKQQKEKPNYSPFRPAAIPQDKLEAVLMKRGKELGADIRMGHTLKTFNQDGDGVTANVVDSQGNEVTIEAAYMIAADGHRSPIRTALGIQRQGRGHIRTIRSVLFHAPALDVYLATGVRQFSISQPDFSGFVTTYGDSRWALMFEDDQERSHQELDRCIIKAAGREDFERKIIATGRWEMTALIADTFQVDRIFLSGDAAHTLPPNRGGYGANTGIDDAHNLAWKLAAVLRLNASSKLLETYDVERRPIAWLRLKQIFARADYQPFAAGISDGVDIIDDNAMEFGQRYGTTEEHQTIAEAKAPDEWNGCIGTRAPHAWITIPEDNDSEQRKSTLDLVDNNKWLLFTTSSMPLNESDFKVPLCNLVLDLDVSSSTTNLLDLYGLPKGRCILIRPDGYIAWKGPQNNQAVQAGLRHALCL